MSLTLFSEKTVRNSIKMDSVTNALLDFFRETDAAPLQTSKMAAFVKNSSRP